MRVLMVGMALAVAGSAQMVAAAIQFDRGQMEISGTGGDFAVLVPGTQSGSFGLSDYSACDGNEEGCIGLPYGGRYANGSWSVTINGNGLTHRFDLFQGSDIGGPLFNDYLLELNFIADRPVRMGLSGKDGVTTEQPCGACGHIFNVSSSAYARDDGRWDVNFSAFMQGTVPVGGQRLFQESQLRIAEVPEPASWALLIAGFGLVGAATRRQQRHCAV
jgi:hypothetical protein